MIELAGLDFVESGMEKGFEEAGGLDMVAVRCEDSTEGITKMLIDRLETSLGS